MRLFLLPAALFLTAFSFAPPHRNLASPTPVFNAEEFFTGRSEGRGTVKVKLKPASTVRVSSVGKVEQGVLILDQKVERPGKPTEQRQWRMRKAGPGRYTGTLSDADGPVRGEVTGNCLHLRYKLKKGGVQADQYLYLQADGRSALNRMSIRKFGIHVATVEETIRKVG